MATEGDPYLIVTKILFDNKSILDCYLDAVLKVIDRHDILRTAIMWESLSSPVQVVLRHAKLSVTQLSLDPSGARFHPYLICRPNFVLKGAILA
ncbi:hypothetical protein BGX26_002188, partial [Mortierella sp. AD094]